MQGNRGDSRLLVVRSQFGNLTPDPSFDHNMCFRCPNGSCEPILDTFQELSNDVRNSSIWWVFDPYNRSLKIWESIETPTPKMGITRECGRTILPLSHTLNLPGTWSVTPGLHSWPAPLQAFALVASPRLGLRQICYYKWQSVYLLV
jgi:hypothetical protein